MIKSALLNKKVSELLGTIHGKRLIALDKLTLSALLNKNPYLYQSHGHTRPEELIDALLAARVSSSDETIFGNAFFEPLALWAAQTAKIAGRTVSVSDAAGADITIVADKYYYAIAVKSGTKIFNSQSSIGQSTEFKATQGRMKKLGKSFLPLIGYGYGRSKATPDSAVDKKAGQEFWLLLTEEINFYLRISDAITSCAGENKIAYDNAYEVRRAKFVKEFMIGYTDAVGQIDWQRLVAFNSAIVKPKKPPLPAKTKKQPQQDE
jgi:Type II restriction endonuclease EcoO109I